MVIGCITIVWLLVITICMSFQLFSEPLVRKDVDHVRKSGSSYISLIPL